MINPEKLNFKHLIMTIGNLPSSYVESLSYYECLLWLCNYIENTVIPAVNNNASALEELQGLFTQLQEYVDNYFENLDVQEEINNKLDDMVEDGTIKSLINDDIFSEINNKVLQNTADISANTEELSQTVKQGQTNSVSMDMLTQEVKEALTGGSTAVVGTDSVGDTNIQDKAISIFKLDDYLQGTKSISYGDPIDLGERNAGFVRVIDNVMSIVSGEDYSYLMVNLTKDKIYSFTGYNLALACGLVVADSENNVIYNSNPDGTSSSGFNETSLVFKVNATGLKAYISINKPLYDSDAYVRYFARYNTPLLREINVFTNSFKTITPKKIKTLEHYFLGYEHDTYGMPRTYSYNETDVEIYEMCKGMHYEISAYNWSSAVGIYIFALDNSIIYQSTNSAVGNTHISITRDFIATQDGYIALLKHGTYGNSIEIKYDLVNSSAGSSSELGFDKWYCLGDSITETNFRAAKNYHDYIADELGIEIVNLGHSGSGYMHENSGVTLISEIGSIVGYNYNTDIITVMGSINDFSHIATSLGQLGDTTTDTLYGCIYTFCNTLFTTYVGARIGIICPTPTDVYHSNKATFDTYNKALKETAELFSIPVLDLSEKSNLKPWITNFKNQFFSSDGTGASGQSDTVHPNSKGHWLIHNEIKEFIKGL